MTATSTTTLDMYRDQFDAVARRMPADLRRRALDRFLELGFPTLRQEDWRFTNVTPIAETAFRPAEPAEGLGERDLAGELIEGWPRLVFVNGRYAEALSDPGEHLALGSLLAAGDLGPAADHLAAYADWREHPFTALNTAFMADGAVVSVPDGAILETPIDVLFVTTAGAGPAITHPRNLIVVGAGSQATVVERYVGLGEAPEAGGFTNAVTEIVAGPNATVDHYKVGREHQTSFHVGTVRIQQGADSTVHSHTTTIGGRLVRNDLTTVLDGPGAHGALNGLYLSRGRQHVDNHLRVEHAQPHCDSREFFKGILEDRARAVFTGRIVVHEDAQKTDAKQTNMNLLLSEDAQVDTKPQLEIFADDVKCTHGATVGQIDDEAIFYLRSRGVPAEAARAVLVYAFAAESIDRVRPEPLRDRLREMLFDRLPHGDLLRGSV